MHDKLNVWSCCQCCSGPFAWSLYSACLHCQHFPCEACDFYYTPEYEEIKSTQTQLTLNENVGPKEDKRHKPKIDHEELDETRRSSLEIEDKMHALDLGDAQDTKSSPSPKLYVKSILKVLGFTKCGFGQAKNGRGRFACLRSFTILILTQTTS